VIAIPAQTLHWIVLGGTAFVLLLLVLQYGGLLDSLRRLGSRGPVVGIILIVLALSTALALRAGWTMTPAYEREIAVGPTIADTVSRGFDTKGRFFERAQPLGRVLDANGAPLAAYALVDGHVQRTWPAGSATSHLIGYWTGPLRDGVGIERAMTMRNDQLRDGLPHDAQLTLDLRLQREALRALGGNNGAIIVMDASNGALLAAADLPTYDPARVWYSDAWSLYANDQRSKPLVSRAVRDNFSPGSSIKPLIAAAALHRYGGSLPDEGRWVCTGSYTPGRGIPPVSCHGTAHGAVDLNRAMRVSCNTYFSHLAYDVLGFESTATYLEGLGFNSRLRWNCTLPLNETTTLLPTSSWVRGRDAIARSRLGIGQASVKMNPIHYAAVLAGIANGGRFPAPVIEQGRPADTLPWHISSTDARTLESLFREPLLPGGTAAGAFPGGGVRGITVYGKTGTADREPDGREPSWFASYGRKNGRTYVVVVAIQNRRNRLAGDVNAPMARTMYDALDRYGYFKSEQ